MIKERYVLAHGPKQMSRKSWASRGWAQRELDRLLAIPTNRRMYDFTQWDVVSLPELRARDYMVEVRSLMNGAMVSIPASQVGTCCDPSTETYWSM